MENVQSAKRYAPTILGIEHRSPRDNGINAIPISKKDYEQNVKILTDRIDQAYREGKRSLGVELPDTKVTDVIIRWNNLSPKLNTLPARQQALVSSQMAKVFSPDEIKEMENHFKYSHFFRVAAHARSKGMKVMFLDSELINRIIASNEERHNIETAEHAQFIARDRKMTIKSLQQKPEIIIVGATHAVAISKKLGVSFESLFGPTKEWLEKHYPALINRVQEGRDWYNEGRRGLRPASA